MKPVLIVGIDGFDRGILATHSAELPTLKSFHTLNPNLKATSTFPPDSTTAWATIYTSTNPGQHGVVDFVDPLEKVAKLVGKEQTVTGLRGNSFWDIASEAGKQVALIFPHLAHPAWRVNGRMVTRSTVSDEIASTPDASEALELRHLNVLKSFPGGPRQRKDFLTQAETLVRNEFEYAERVLNEQKWDLFFFYTSTLDFLEHFLWPQNQEGLAGTELLEFYRLHDRLLKRLFSHAEEDYVKFILSDHGHGPRPSTAVNVNALLNERGLVRIPHGQARMTASITKQVQQSAIKFVTLLHLEEAARIVLKRLPASRKVFTNPTFIDAAASKAYLSDFSGIKAYSYGGVRINPTLSDSERVRVRAEVCAVLKHAHDDSGPLFAWVEPRETIVHGPHTAKFPEVLFLLREGFGAGRDPQGPIVSKGQNRQLVPGSHRVETPVFLTSMALKGGGRNCSLQDFAPTILTVLGVRIPPHYEGTALEPEAEN